MLSRPSLVFCAVTLGVTGCGGADTPGPAAYSDALTSGDAQNAVVLTTLTGASMVATNTASAAAAAASVTSVMKPSGCVTDVIDGNKVTYTFDDCTGPYGLAKVSGTLTVTYTASLTNVVATLSSSGLTVGPVTLMLAGHAVYTESAAGPSVVLTPSGSATGPSGHTISWTGNIDLTVNGSCADVTGSYTLNLEGAMLTVVATDYERCEAACPAAGGSLSFSSLGASVTFSFDGSSAATYQLRDGKTGSVSLACGS